MYCLPDVPVFETAPLENVKVFAAEASRPAAKDGPENVSVSEMAAETDGTVQPMTRADKSVMRGLMAGVDSMVFELSGRTARNWLLG